MAVNYVTDDESGFEGPGRPPRELLNGSLLGEDAAIPHLGSEGIANGNAGRLSQFHAEDCIQLACCVR